MPLNFFGKRGLMMNLTGLSLGEERSRERSHDDTEVDTQIEEFEDCYNRN